MANPQQFFDPFFLVDRIDDLVAKVTAESDVVDLFNDVKLVPYRTKLSALGLNAEGFVSSLFANVPFLDQYGEHTSSALGGTTFRDIVEPMPDQHIDDHAGLIGVPVLPTKKSELPVTGQGTVAVKSKAQKELTISVRTESTESNTLLLRINTSGAQFFYRTSHGDEHPIPAAELKGKAACALDVNNEGHKTTYWVSIDRGNGYLRYGKYYTNKQLILLEAVLKKKSKDGVMVWENPTQYKWLEDLKNVDINEDSSTTDDPTLAIQPLPIVMDLPPFVISGDKVTLLELENGQVTAPANLPAACQKLYGNVAGASIELNDADFPNFTNAIEWSCSNENGWCFKKLKSKAKEFGDDAPLMTYLRITIGYNQGDSPGVPYVLEIWPSGHYSPVHDHGDACAVIKVLHGEINATFYDTLSKPHPAVIQSPAALKEGQVTWLGQQNYQIHKLHNTGTKVCCTIQCYRYEDQDNVHYDGFRYKDGNGKLQTFIPNSDMSFSDFRKLMKDEWAKSLEMVAGHH